MTNILMACSIKLAVEDGAKTWCPCKYPFVTLRCGIINTANETHLITKAASYGVFPPVIFPK